MEKGAERLAFPLSHTHFHIPLGESHSATAIQSITHPQGFLLSSSKLFGLQMSQSMGTRGTQTVI